jgi:hypothetical protein
MLKPFMFFFPLRFIIIIVFQAIALFRENKHEEAMRCVHQLAVNCPDTDFLVRRAVEVSIVQSSQGLCIV